jgi:hypothetical protein
VSTLAGPVKQSELRSARQDLHPVGSQDGSCSATWAMGQQTSRLRVRCTNLSVATGTLPAMNIDIWLPPVLAAIIGALLSPSAGTALLTLAAARARRVKHMPIDGAEMYTKGIPLDEAQFRAVFAAYQAELEELPPPAARNEWEMKRQYAASQRLAVITGTHPHAFPNLGDPEQAWEWYRDKNSYATAARPCRHGFRLLPPGDIATD